MMNQMKSVINPIIKNREALLSHGQVKGRKSCLDIIEYALNAVDPYHATHKAVQLIDETLIVAGRKYNLETMEPLAEKKIIYIFRLNKG